MDLIEPEELRYNGPDTLSRFARTSERLFSLRPLFCLGCSLGQSMFGLIAGQLHCACPPRR